jgi:hypothetical protein
LLTAAGWYAAPNETLLKVREQMKITETRVAHFETISAQQLARARDIMRTGGNKTVAGAALRQHKQAQVELVRLNNLLGNLAQQESALANAEFTQSNVSTMKETERTMKAVHRWMGPEEVSDLTNRLQSRLEDQDELSQLLGESIAPSSMAGALDEATLEEELEELAADDLDLSLERVRLESAQARLDIELVQAPAAATPAPAPAAATTPAPPPPTVRAAALPHPKKKKAATPAPVANKSAAARKLANDIFL